MADDLKTLADTEQAAKRLGLPFVRLTADDPTAEALALVPESLAREYRVLPVALHTDDRSVTVAVGDPSLLSKPAPAFLQDLKSRQKLRLVLQLTPPADFEAALAAYAKGTSSAVPASVPSVPSPTPAAPVNAAPAATSPKSAPGVPPAPVVADSPSAVVAPAQQPEQLPASVHSATLPSVSLVGRTIPRDVLERFPEDVAKKYGMVVFALSEDGNAASVALTKPNDSRVREILKFVESRNGVRLELFATDRQSLAAALAQYGAPTPTDRSHVQEVGQKVSESKQSSSAASTKAENESSSLPTKAKVETAVPASTAAKSTPDVPLQQASTDAVRDAAKVPGQGSVVAVPRPKPAPISPSVAAPATPVAAVGAIRPAVPVASTTPSQYQQQATRNSRTTRSAAVVANVPVIEAADLTAPGVGLGGAPLTQPQMEERNLDTILGGQISDVGALEQAITSGLIPKVVAAVLSYAITLGSSDIHIEAGKESVRVRYRVDGKLQEVIRLPLTLLAPFVSRIKILAKLKIDESRVPQDGRFDVEAGGRQIDLRVSTLPTVYGEKVVLRLLDKAAGLKKLDELGISGTNLERVRSVIDDPYGIILVTGPTGSGKTTTLYAMLSEVNTPDVNIVTLEDPVEYQIDGINQTQVRPKIGFGFADGLRSILRQDPNIIMVGEIRDRETAALATQAALTGHLVLATLHTNDAAGAIPRMLDMGVEPFLLASSVRAVIAQRLVRQLVPDGRTEVSVPAEELEAVKTSLGAGKSAEVQQAAGQTMTFYGPAATDQGTGYKGRIGIYEVLTISDAIAQLTLQKAPASKIEATAIAEGMVTLRQDGILKALAGQTSLGEVLQATGE